MGHSIQPSPRMRLGLLRAAAAALALVGTLPLSGCVVWEIRDELRQANLTLANADRSLHETNQLLTGVRHDLEALQKTNDQLAQVGEKLASADERLKLLTTIDASLRALDAHLASLRKTLENIDSTIPFLSFAADEDPAATMPATQPDGSTPPTQPTTRPVRRRPPPRPPTESPPAESAPATQPGV